MTKVTYPSPRSGAGTRIRGRRWLIVTLAAITGSTLWAATNGAEQNDSGWATGTPSALGYNSKAHDTHQQIILHRVLEETQPRLLTKPSPSSSTPMVAEPAHGGMRFAIRPDGIDGWRPVGQSAPPLSGGAVIHSLPSLPSQHMHAPAISPKEKADEEVDCNGGPPAAPANPAEVKHTETNSAEARSISAAASSAESDEEETCQGKTALNEEPDSDAEAEVDDATAVDDQMTAEDEADESAATDEVDTSAAEAQAEPESNAPININAATNARTTEARPVAPPKTAAVPPPPLTKQLIGLRTRVRSVLTGYYRKTLNSKDNDPWEVMHGMLAYGINSRIRQGGPRGDAITAVGWLCYNKPCKGQTLLYVNPDGEVRAKYGVGLQGHLGQLLAMLAQCHVSPDYPIHVGKNEFTIRDLIEAEKKTCYPKSELTFKLIALQHYIDLNDKWVNDQGVEWGFPRLMREEMAQPIRGAACGGTHRLSGLSLAVKTRVRRGEPLDGEYAKADEFVKKYQQYAFRLQNRDGSLSTSWFRGAGDDDDIDRRIKTTGHILEWLCYSLSDEELRDQRTIRAVTYLANLMYSNYDNEWEVGPRCHATHALLLYDERVFRPFDKEGAVAVYRPTPEIARSNQASSTRR